ncbi:MAG: 50S ribosomal protein L29 [Verrucomicrobiota bacterium]
MKIDEVKALNELELRSKAQELRQERLNLRLQQLTGQLEKPSRLKDIRKTLARIETVLSNKRLKQISSKQEETAKEPQAA